MFDSLVKVFELRGVLNESLFFYIETTFALLNSSKLRVCKCMMFPILKLKIQSSVPKFFIPRDVRAFILYFYSN
jgi:hypothetical protein